MRILRKLSEKLRLPFPGIIPVLTLAGTFVLLGWSQPLPLSGTGWCAPAVETNGEPSTIVKMASIPVILRVISEPDAGKGEPVGVNPNEGSPEENDRDEGAVENGMPETPHPDIGRMPLFQLCARYGLNLQTVLKTLADNEIEASASMSITQIADKNDLTPLDVYELIREVAEMNPPSLPEPGKDK